MSILPFEYDCASCSTALACISAAAPPAAIALFIARKYLVDFFISPFTLTKRVTPCVAEFNVVGSPDMPSSSSFSAALESLALMPRLFMTFGKLLSWSYLLTASSMLLDTALIAPLTALMPICMAEPSPIALLNLLPSESVDAAAFLMPADRLSFSVSTACTV